MLVHMSILQKENMQQCLIKMFLLLIMMGSTFVIMKNVNSRESLLNAKMQNSTKSFKWLRGIKPI